MACLIDITPTVTEGIAVFPGDVAYSRDIGLDLESGDNLTLSSIRTTLHLGAHTDAPSHYAKGASGIAERELDIYYGPCQVITVAGLQGQRLKVEDISVAIDTPRVLFNTGTFPDPNQWNGDFAALSAELVHHLADQGVRLVGIDTPSIDPADDKVLESHNAVAKRDMAILEGIILSHVPDGHYELIALPLKLKGADASPVRAVLVARES